MYIRFSLFCFGLLLLFICCIVEIFKIEIILVVFTICGCCAKVACTITYFKREYKGGPNILLNLSGFS